jgi:hypothetical protein
VDESTGLLDTVYLPVLIVKISVAIFMLFCSVEKEIESLIGRDCLCLSYRLAVPLLPELSYLCEVYTKTRWILLVHYNFFIVLNGSLFVSFLEHAGVASFMNHELHFFPHNMSCVLCDLQ